MSEAKKTSSSSDDFNDPDRQNPEQDETGTQAQDVAEEALTGENDIVEESEKDSPPMADVVPRDVPDLVDKMKEMQKSGRIDRGAFQGEEDMDDEAED